MPLTSRDFLAEERQHHQVAALHRAAAAAAAAGLYHYYQHHRTYNNPHQAWRNSLLSNCTDTLQTGGQYPLSSLGMTPSDFEKTNHSQVGVSRRTSLQNFMKFSTAEQPAGGSDQSHLQQASPEMLMRSEVIEDIESLFDDDEVAPSSKRAQGVLPPPRRASGAVHQGQQQTRHSGNLLSPSSAILQAVWERDPAISGMVSTRRNLHQSSSLATTTKVATIRTNTQGHQQHAFAGKQCLKRTGFEVNNYAPRLQNAPADSVAALMTEHNFHVTKKPRHCIQVDDNKSEGESLSEDRRFRSYQAEQWADRFAELCAFQKEKGNCQEVPHCYPKNPALSRWVKRQRYQHKLKTEGKPSTMADERIEQLEKIGFVWDSHSSGWVERFNELRAFRERAGHCNVPSNFADSPHLATWVKCQRRQYKLFGQGKTSNINLHRIEQLHGIGFEWVLRGRDRPNIAII